MQRVLTLLFSVVFIHISFSQNKTKPVLTAKKVVSQQVWVDSIYNQFSFEEKIKQLFIVPAYSNKDEAHNK